VKRHPTDGTLRRLVDEPAGVADADRGHVAQCPQCQTGLAAARRDAALTGAALTGTPLTGGAAVRLEAEPDMDMDVDVDAAWQRLSRAAAVGGRARSPRGQARWRTTMRSPVLAATAVVALLVGAGAAAAANWLPIFRTERIAPVTATQVDLAKLPELEAFGEVKMTEKPNLHKVSDAAAASKESGLGLPRVSGLPRGVTGEPAYLVGGRASAEFTFSAEKAARFVTAAGGVPPVPPAGLDGSQFRLVAGPGVAMVWAEDRPMPAMIVARAKAPTVFSSGIPFETARDYLLSLPGLPPGVASQLRAFSGEGTTLPLFVSTDRTTSSTTEIGGVPATVLTPKDGVMAAVVWVDGGVVTAVAGSMSADEVLSVARGLRWDR
jgi:hypothetical protein